MNHSVHKKIQILIDKSDIQESIDDIIQFIIHNKNNYTNISDSNKQCVKEDLNYLKNLYTYNNINYKIYNINKYLHYISEYKNKE